METLRKLAGDNAPWYVALLTTLTAIAREFLAQPSECAVRTIDDLERIVRIAQGLG